MAKSTGNFFPEHKVDKNLIGKFTPTRRDSFMNAIQQSCDLLLFLKKIHSLRLFLFLLCTFNKNFYNKKAR